MQKLRQKPNSFLWSLSNLSEFANSLTNRKIKHRRLLEIILSITSYDFKNRGCIDSFLQFDRLDKIFP